MAKCVVVLCGEELCTVRAHHHPSPALIVCKKPHLHTQLSIIIMRFSLACVTVLAATAREADAFTVPTIKVPPFRSFSSSTTTTELFAEGSTITMPALSSTMKEGRVVSWLKSEGDEISAGEAIMVVESDKADVSSYC